MRRKYLVYDPQDERDLRRVLTIAESVALTGYAPRTIRFWCDAGYVVARRAGGGVWLISRPSLIKFVRAKKSP